MATPGAAGMAVLIRQYFMDSKFWASNCNTNYNNCKSMKPSGVLIKALLIHSTDKMKMFFDGDGSSKNVALGTPPDFYQGYGRIDISNVLPLPGLTNFDLFVDDGVSIDEYSQISYSTDVSDSSVPLM